MTCSRCGVGFVEHKKNGAPFRNCSACRERWSRRYVPRSAGLLRSCERCGADISDRHANAKYCSVACLNLREVCDDCGRPCAKRTTHSADALRCAECHRAATAAAHGSSGMYKRGCRCDICREGQRVRMADYARRKGAWPSTVRRRLKMGVDPATLSICVVCDEPMSRLSSAQRPMHRDCKETGVPQYRVKRAAVIVRDEGRCQICRELVDLDAGPYEPMSVNLDHVVPRSCGGSHDVANLRLTHRACNLRRGAGRSSDEEVAAWALARS